MLVCRTHRWGSHRVRMARGGGYPRGRANHWAEFTLSKNALVNRVYRRRGSWWHVRRESGTQ